MGKDSTVVTAGPADLKAKSFLHALSEIQQLSAVEYRTDIPDGVIPFIPMTSFADVAARTAATGTIYTFLVSPFSIAVIDKILPVFGTYNPSFIDKCFSYLLAAAPVLAITLLTAFILLEHVYMGKTVKKMVDMFLLSFIGTKIIVSFIVTILFLWLYTSVFTEQWILNHGMSFVNWGTSDKIKNLIYEFINWLIEFRRIIPQALKFSVILHMGTSALLGVVYIYSRRRSHRLRLLRQEWE